MHNIDRTQLEMNTEFENFELENFELENFEMSGEFNEVLNEALQHELAAELLEVRDEQELDRYLGKLITTASGALGRAIRSPIGQAIGGNLKKAAKQFLPKAVGGFGGKLGENLASALTTKLGLNTGDRADGARIFVNAAANAVNMATNGNASPDPHVAAQNAVNQALRGTRGSSANQGSSAVHGQSGRWFRRGNRVILYGI